MARLLSPVWSVIRGSIAGTTYLSNQWHQIVARARTAPVNPSTPNQYMIRSAFASASSAWKTLTESQQQAWDDYAATCIYTGPLGTYTIPGRQMFIANIGLVTYMNSVDPLNPLTPVLTAPTVPGFLTSFSLEPSTPTTTPSTGIAFSCVNETGGTLRLFTERSFAFAPSRNRYKGPFLSNTAQMHVVAASTTQVVEYLDLVPGAAYFIRVRAYTPTTAHKLSAEYIIRDIATTQDL